MKIYVHHYYSEPLFYLLAHNTTDRIFELTDNCGSVKCKYNAIHFEFIFKPQLSDEPDGYHLIDWTALRAQIQIDEKLKCINENKRIVEFEIVNNFEQNTILYNLVELLKHKSNWIFTFFCGEKSLLTNESVVYDNKLELIYDLERSLFKLNKFKIIFEEYFLKKEIESKYQNFYYAFSNIMWYWNNFLGIRLYYEFKQIYDNLNFEYDLCYSVRAHKYNRILLLNELKKINQSKLYIQRSDGRKESEHYIRYENKVLDIHLNSREGKTDFANLTLVDNQKIGLDLFFRVLPKAKMHILDESWAFSKNDFASNYLSEKTIGFIVSGIPFISTHNYPLEIIQKLLNVPPHPFLEESKKIKGDAILIAKFVDEFMNNFDENFKLCKNWIDECHLAFMQKLNNENSLLDLILKDFNVENSKHKKILI